jgi:hypothetical protein
MIGSAEYGRKQRNERAVGQAVRNKRHGLIGVQRAETSNAVVRLAQERQVIHQPSDVKRPTRDESVIRRSKWLIRKFTEDRTFCRKS